MRTFSAKPGEIKPRWFIVDAADKPIGRTASKIATILQGKNKPTYTPHVDTGDYVIVINSAKARLTGNKLNDKMYHHHTGWMGGLVSKSAKDLLERKPTELMKLAVKGMLPKTRLGKDMLNKLKLHPGPCPEHGYVAQGAEKLEL